MSRASSNKAKGRLGQQEVRDILLDYFTFLEPDDIRSTSMGAQGCDILLSPKAQRVLGIQIEVKRSKKMTAQRWMEQAAGHGLLTPTVWFREDGRNKEFNVILPAKDFLKLIELSFR